MNSTPRALSSMIVGVRRKMAPYFVIAESGAYTLVAPQPAEADFERLFAQVLNATGCAAGGVACLEGTSADVLLAFAESLRVAGFVLEPVVDGVDLDDQVVSRLAHGRVAPGVPLLAGATRDDLGYDFIPFYEPAQPEARCGGRNFSAALELARAQPCTEDDFRAYLHRVSRVQGMGGLDAERMVDTYGAAEVALPGGPLSKWYWATMHAGSDYFMICPAALSASLVAAAAAPSFAYLFAHAPDGPAGAYPHLAHHTSEIPFVFHDTSASGPNASSYRISARERPLADAIVHAWAAFATTGDPSTDALEWPAYGATAGFMEFGAAGGGLGAAYRPGLKRANCEGWRNVSDPPHPEAWRPWRWPGA